MENSFEITFNIMGDPANKKAFVTRIPGTDEYLITMPDGNHRVNLEKKGENWVQTFGTPLDSNTIHSIAEALNKRQMMF